MRPTVAPPSMLPGRSAARDVTATPDAAEVHTTRSRSLLPIVFALWSFGVTMVLAPYYLGGDQVHYRAFYESREGADVVDSFTDYGNMVGANEPVYFVFVTLFSSWLDKDIYISLVNALVGYLLGRALNGLNASLFVVVLLPLNHYLLVLYLAAERLKVGVLFLLIANELRRAPRYVSFLVAILSHVQTTLTVAGYVLTSLLPTLGPLFRGKLRGRLFWQAIALGFLSIPIYFMWDHMSGKIEFYMATDRGELSLLKPLVFLLVTVFYARDRKLEAFAMHLPLVVGSLFVGVGRIVLFSYFTLMYYGFGVRRGINVGVIVSSLYFAMAGIVFIFDVMQYGTGFYWDASAFMRLFL